MHGRSRIAVADAIIAKLYPSTTVAFEPKKNAATTKEKLPFEADIPALR